MASRHQIIKIHLIISGLVLPLALAYFTGGLIYTLGGSGDVDKILYSLPAQNINEIQTIVNVTKSILSAKNITLPVTDPHVIKSKKNDFKIVWSTLSQSIIFEQKYLANEAHIIVKDRSALTKLMRMHRGEAGLLFKILSTMLVLGLVLTMLAGAFLAFTIPTYRIIILKAAMLGLVVPLIFIMIAY